MSDDKIITVKIRLESDELVRQLQRVIDALGTPEDDE